jgi:putative flippase GtrA
MGARTSDSNDATRSGSAGGEGLLALKHAAVSLLGFAADFMVLRLMTRLGVDTPWARAVSLGCAMQLTYVINGMHVFRALDRDRPIRQWLKYMGSNGFGNFCNYWMFLTLVSTHWRVVSAPLFALAAGSFTAWTMNYACARFWIFRRAKTS